MGSLWTEAIEGMIAAYMGEGSLAGNPDVRAAIRALDERGAFVAYRNTTVESITTTTRTPSRTILSGRCQRMNRCSARISS